MTDTEPRKFTVLGTVVGWPNDEEVYAAGAYLLIEGEGEVVPGTFEYGPITNEEFEERFGFQLPDGITAVEFSAYVIPRED
ncbi:hypothetical protein [Mycobacterium phage SWU1]|uniref:Uncharacterized protein n=1 Tax=Mycobacterium phage SWU1 TaxID=1175504 RepID=I1V1H3_9CAUD|nr:hypothetical protein A321_gp55 [Mycobacterium phage SWU1]AFI24951.1 hypothetical protein [Mycobacterium phage SWU1]